MKKKSPYKRGKGETYPTKMELDFAENAKETGKKAPNQEKSSEIWECKYKIKK